VVFHVTERCARSCRHCLREPARLPADLPAALVDRVIGEAVALHGIDHVGFTGGEPLLHPAFGDLVDAAVRRGLGWHVVTSGREHRALLALLDADPRRREALTAVDLSLDGADEAVHDAVRGAGSYREVLATALELRARQVPFSMQMTVHAENAHQVEALAMQAAQLGAAGISFGMTVATGTDADRALSMPLAAWRAVRDRVERLVGILSVPVRIAEGFPRLQPFHACEPWRSEILHVDPRGRLTLCCQLSGAPGGDEDVIADLATTPLLDAHRALLDRIHRLERERLEAVAGGAGPWELLQCNWCARRHGRPHWIEGGSAGPRSRRAVRGDA
jgi:MoaA/NifB/PqqE/SkfB family radical SAM enzyme